MNTVMENLAVTAGPIRARLDIPGSKSIANRALICAALAEGTSILTNVAPGDDTEALRECLLALGVSMIVQDGEWEIRGTNGVLQGGSTLSARLAGTTSRFMIAVSALAAEPTIVTGEQALRRRPIAPLQHALQSLGASVQSLDESMALPVQVSRAELSGGRVKIRGDVSSQYISALMMIGPLLDGGLELEITSPLISVPYVAITAHVMACFGIEGIEVSSDLIVVPQGGYQAQRFTIEPDASSASYPLAAAAICGGVVEIPGLGSQSIQGDVGFVDILRAMGCRVDQDTQGVTVHGPDVLHGVQLNLRDMSDLVPTVAAMAVFADSPTEISGVGFIRSKESDRIGDVVRALQVIGCDAAELPDGLVIRPHPGREWRGHLLPTHHDHRLAMAWSLIALKVPGISIEDPDVVTKSWPNWWTVREQIVNSAKGEWRENLVSESNE